MLLPYWNKPRKVNLPPEKRATPRTAEIGKSGLDGQLENKHAMSLCDDPQLPLRAELLSLGARSSYLPEPKVRAKYKSPYWNQPRRFLTRASANPHRN